MACSCIAHIVALVARFKDGEVSHFNEAVLLICASSRSFRNWPWRFLSLGSFTNFSTWTFFGVALSVHQMVILYDFSRFTVNFLKFCDVPIEHRKSISPVGTRCCRNVAAMLCSDVAKTLLECLRMGIAATLICNVSATSLQRRQITL